MDHGFDLNYYLMHHLTDANEWRLPFSLTIRLPHFLTLHGLMLLIAAGFLVLVFCVVYRKEEKVPKGFTNALEAIIIYIRDEISIKYLGENDGRKMTPVFCTFFFLILTLNVMGLVPLFAGASANLNVTGGLALITLSFMIFGTIYKNGIKGFFKSLIPSGVPPLVLLVIVPIEFLGLFIKSFALTMRLFANMLAGHIVIISLLGIIVLMGVAATPAIILAVGVSLLEVFVAFLQAYIFTILSAMFIGQMYHPSH